MLGHRQGGRRAERRAFRPGLDGRLDLESRLLLSAARVSAAAAHHPTGHIQYFTAFGGSIARIVDTDGEIYNVDITGGGRIRAKPMSGGRVKLIVEGSLPTSVVSINPKPRNIRKGTAHDYPANAARGDHLLHIGAVKISTGRIGQILGYQTADLSGPIVVASDSPVDRIAFYSYQPGAAITTGGDLNTLDAFTDMNLGGGGSISVGRDLNLINVGGNLTIGDGSSLLVGRDIGLVAQPAKGSDAGGAGGFVGGNVNVEPGGAFTIGRSLQTSFIVNGVTDGGSRITIPFGASNYLSRGGINP